MITRTETPHVPGWVDGDLFPTGDEDRLDTLATAWTGQAERTEGQAEDLDRTFRSGARSYEGDAAEAATAHVAKVRQFLTSTAEACTSVGAACTEASSAIRFAKTAMNVSLLALETRSQQLLAAASSPVDAVRSAVQLRQMQILTSLQIRAIHSAAKAKLAAVEIEVDIHPNLTVPPGTDSPFAPRSPRTLFTKEKVADVAGQQQIPLADGTGGAPFGPGDGTDPTDLVGNEVGTGGDDASGNQQPLTGPDGTPLTGPDGTPLSSVDPEDLFDASSVVGGTDPEGGGSSVDGEGPESGDVEPGDIDTAVDTGLPDTDAGPDTGTEPVAAGDVDLTEGPDSSAGPEGAGAAATTVDGTDPGGSPSVNDQGPAAGAVVDPAPAPHQPSVQHHTPPSGDGGRPSSPVANPAPAPAAPPAAQQPPAPPPPAPVSDLGAGPAPADHGGSGGGPSGPAPGGTSSPGPAPVTPPPAEPAAPGTGAAGTQPPPTVTAGHPDGGAPTGGAAPPPGSGSAPGSGGPSAPGSSGPGGGASGPHAPTGGGSGAGPVGGGPTGGPMGGGQLGGAPLGGAGGGSAAPNAPLPQQPLGGTPLGPGHPNPQPAQPPTQPPAQPPAAPPSGGGQLGSNPARPAPVPADQLRVPDGAQRAEPDPLPSGPDETASPAVMAASGLPLATLGLVPLLSDLRRRIPAATPRQSIGLELLPTQFGPGDAPLAALPAGLRVVYQKVLLPGEAEAHLHGQVRSLRGLLHLHDQIDGITSPQELHDLLGLGFAVLDAHGQPRRVFDAEPDSIDVLRCAGIRDSDLVIPVAPDASPATGSPIPPVPREHARPWTGSGLAPGSSEDRVIEEFELLPEVGLPIPHLAEIWRFHADGRAEHLGTHNARTGAWQGLAVTGGPVGQVLGFGPHAVLDDGSRWSATVLNDHEYVLVDHTSSGAAGFVEALDRTSRRVVDRAEISSLMRMWTTAVWRGARVVVLATSGTHALVDYADQTPSLAAGLGFVHLGQGQWQQRWVPGAELAQWQTWERTYPPLQSGPARPFAPAPPDLD